MLRVIIGFLLIVTFANPFYSQEIKTDVKNEKIIQGTENVAGPQDITDDIKFKNETGNAIITITDEGSNVGSITLPSGSAPSTPTNKLYNVGGTLNFNGTALGSGGASVINDLTDAKYDGSSLSLGEGAGTNTTISKNSVAVGKNALYTNTSGGSNTAVGRGALYTNSSGNDNTAMGHAALGNNSLGSSNSAFGKEALLSNKTGIGNIAVGHVAMKLNTTGDYNTAIGDSALYSNVSANFGVAIGFGSQRFVTNNFGMDNKNTSVGYESLRGGTTPANNTGGHNSAFGYQTLVSNSKGVGNTAIGYQALMKNTTGYDNTAIGKNALIGNTTGDYNTANGFNALYANSTGNHNTATGNDAMLTNTDGEGNTAFGAKALQANQDGNENTAIGYYALQWNLSGNGNTAVGNKAGPNFQTLSNTTALGNWAMTTASDQVRIGNSTVSSIGGYAGWANVSDGRYKRNISEDVNGIEFIMGLRPITYNLDIELLSDQLNENVGTDENGNSYRRELTPFMREARTKKGIKRYTGFVAQEVEELANKIGYDFSGVEVPENEESMYMLRYSEFVVPIVKAMQEQQAMIDELRKEIEILKGK